MRPTNGFVFLALLIYDIHAFAILLLEISIFNFFFENNYLYKEGFVFCIKYKEIIKNGKFNTVIP